MAAARKKTFNLRLASDEIDVIKRQAIKYGLSAADVVRLWIRAGAPVVLVEKKK